MEGKVETQHPPDHALRSSRRPRPSLAGLVRGPCSRPYTAVKQRDAVPAGRPALVGYCLGPTRDPICHHSPDGHVSLPCPSSTDGANASANRVASSPECSPDSLATSRPATTSPDWSTPAPVQGGRSREPVKRVDLAGHARCGYCASRSRSF